MHFTVGEAVVGRLVVPAHFRGQRGAHIRRAGSAFEPVFRRAAT
jgi:hypothetical protein